MLKKYFEEWTQSIKHLSEEDYEDFFADFFTEDNYLEYGFDQEVNPETIKANEILFNEDEDLMERLMAALAIDFFHPFALFAYVHIADVALVHKAFEKVYALSKDLEHLNDQQLEFVYFFLDVYADFLVQIRNLSKALKVQKTIESKYGHETSYMIRNGIIYSVLEKDEEFYDYYLKHEFKDPILYLFLLIVLLKNDQEEKANIVFNELIAMYPCFEYIDHPWDIEMDESDEAQQFFHVLETCIQDLEGVPNFFEWCALNKEEVYKS